MSTTIPTYLYIKQHTKTGKLYFGKTTKDPLKYKGSGKHWLRHIKIHGIEYVETIWYCLYYDYVELSKFALMYSEQENIVDSDIWLNLKFENGLDGGSSSGVGNGVFGKKITNRKRISVESRKRMSAARLAYLENNPVIISEEQKSKISSTMLERGSTKGMNHPLYGKTGVDNPNYGKTRTDEFKERHSKLMSGENNGMYGKHLSEEVKRKKSEKMTGYKYKIISCPHCGKSGGEQAMKRWHFDKCKQYTSMDCLE